MRRVRLETLMCGILVMAVALDADRRAFASDTPQPMIQVKSVIEVDGSKPDITLGDLIVTRGFSHDVVDAIGSVRLADAPNAGEARSFTELGLLQIIRARLQSIKRPVDMANVVLRVPSRVTVTRKKFRLGHEEVKKEMLTRFQSLCTDCQFEISGLSLPAIDLKAHAGSSWRIRFRNELPKGSFSLPLDVTRADGSSQTFWIAGTLTVLRRVPVASRSLMSGEKLSSVDFTMSLKDVTFAHDVPADDQEITESVAARAIGAGQIIWRNQIRRPMAVQSGEPVKVVAGTEDWQISIDGVSQMAGHIGESIRVRIPRTQKVISGLLKEKGIVEVR